MNGFYHLYQRSRVNGFYDPKKKGKKIRYPGLEQYFKERERETERERESIERDRDAFSSVVPKIQVERILLIQKKNSE